MPTQRQLLIAFTGVIIPLIILVIIFQPALTRQIQGKTASIAFVDVQKVFENSSRGKQQISAFQETLTQRSEEVKQQSQMVEGLRQEVEQLVQQGRRREAQQKVPQFEAEQKKLLAMQQQANQELQVTQAEVDKAFMGQLKTVLEKIRQEEHLDVIQAYDPSKTLSFDPTMDLTQKALIKYNESYPLKDRETDTSQKPVKP